VDENVADSILGNKEFDSIKTDERDFQQARQKEVINSTIEE
jgi:hypothetical protein